MLKLFCPLNPEGKPTTHHFWPIWIWSGCFHWTAENLALAQVFKMLLAPFWKLLIGDAMPIEYFRFFLTFSTIYILHKYLIFLHKIEQCAHCCVFYAVQCNLEFCNLQGSTVQIYEEHWFRNLQGGSTAQLCEKHGSVPRRKISVRSTDCWVHATATEYYWCFCNSFYR